MMKLEWNIPVNLRCLCLLQWKSATTGTGMTTRSQTMDRSQCRLEPQYLSRSSRTGPSPGRYQFGHITIVSSVNLLAWTLTYKSSREALKSLKMLPLCKENANKMLTDKVYLTLYCLVSVVRRLWGGWRASRWHPGTWRDTASTTP